MINIVQEGKSDTKAWDVITTFTHLTVRHCSEIITLNRVSTKSRRLAFDLWNLQYFPHLTSFIPEHAIFQVNTMTKLKLHVTFRLIEKKNCTIEPVCSNKTYIKLGWNPRLDTPTPLFMYVSRYLSRWLYSSFHFFDYTLPWQRTLSGNYFTRNIYRSEMIRS